MTGLRDIFLSTEQRLFRAVDDGDIAVVKKILSSHPDAVNWNSFPIYNATPLMWAAQSGRREIAELLLDCGADVAAQDSAGRSVFFYATDGMIAGKAVLHPNPSFKFDPSDHIATAKLLLRRGANPNAPSHDRQTPLSRTIWGFDQVAAFLIDHGADMEARDKYGYTLLMRAAEGKSEKIVRLLLEKGASTTATSPDGRNALQLAMGSDMFANVPHKHEGTIGMLRAATQQQSKQSEKRRGPEPRR